MKTIELSGLKRAASGKKENNVLRTEGRIPCVIYGGGENIHFSVSIKDVKNIIYTPNAYVINVDIEGQKEVVVLREVQYHPVYEQILHIDFYRITPGKPVTIEVPIKLVGNSDGVKLGGKLVLMKRKVMVSALVENLPDFIEVDTTPLGLGASFFVGNIKSDKFTLLTPATAAVCAVNMTRAAKGAADAAAAATPKKK